MLVKLSRPQADRLLDVFGGERRLHRWLSERYGEAQRVCWVAAPAIAWDRMRLELGPRVFNARGYRSQKVPRMEGTALTRITRALVERQTHPAMTRVSMVGRHPEVIPVWDTGTCYTQFPPAQGEFLLLVPRWERYQGWDITLWEPGPPPYEDPLFDEAEHRAFGVHDQRKL